MTYDELSEHLNALERDACYRVDAVMKKSPYEVTEKVYFVGVNGAEQGPYVRKRIATELGLGSAYESIFEAQKTGRRFSYVPRIVECYTMGEERVVVMEYVFGETLQDVVYRCDPSVALAADLFPRICEAVKELHASFDPPLIHRDLKPSNIMVSRGSLTIIDFGIARSFKAGAEADTKHFGTRAYAPPEQFGFGQTDERSDVYALGMLLYFCLTEKTPDAKARAGSFGSPGIPEELRRIIERAVELDPADRYQTVDALMTAVRTAFDPIIRCEAVSSMRAEDPLGASGSRFGTPVAPSGGLVPSAAPMRSGTHPSQDFRNRTADQPSGNAVARVFTRILRGLGIAWDVLLLLVLLVAFVASIAVTVSPDPTSTVAEYSFGRRALSYAAIMLFLFVPVTYFVSDRRPLKKLVPFLGRLSIAQELLVLLACLIALIASFALLMNLP